MKPVILLVCTLGLALAAQAQPASILSGTVLGAEEQPLEGARVSLHPAASRVVLQSVEAGPKGAYRMKIDTTGLFMLVFAGADQARSRVPLLVGAGAPQVEVDARLSARPRITFRNEQSAAARYARFSEALTERREAFMKERAALKRRGARAEDFKDFEQGYDWSPNRALLEAALKEAEQPAFREALLVTYLSGTLEVDSAYARQALDAVDPTSPLWAAKPLALRSALQAVGPAEEAYDAYVTKVLSTHTNAELNASLLLDRLLRAQARGAEDQVGALYERLVTAYPNTLYAKAARSRFDPSHAIRAGASVPVFDVASLDQPDKTYSEKSMKGRIYLLDFWATWCGPCLAEMPRLHEVYERYRDKGFTILSLSFDDSPEAVRGFREARWAMPWLHAFVRGGVDSEVARAFEVVSIPKAILVNAGGNIVATGRNLRGPNLERTLARVLGAVSETEANTNDGR